MSCSNLRLVQWLFVFISLSVFADPSSSHMGQLPNGFTYYIHCDPSFGKRISMDLIVRAGSSGEQEDERGLAHLVEHLVAGEMTFRGVKIEENDCPLWDLSNSEFYALTSYEFTAYHLDIPIAIREGIKSFASILTALPITPQSFHERQQDIFNEIGETESSAAKRWQQKRIDYEYPPYRDKHPLGVSSCIQKATVEKVSRFFHRHYQPGLSAIIVIGNMDVCFTEELIKKYFGTLSDASNFEEIFQQADPPTLGQSVIYFDPELAQAAFSMTQIIPPLSQRDAFLFSIWTHLLKRRVQSALSSSTLDCFDLRIETSLYPPLLRLNVSLTENNPQNGVLQFKEILHSFANNLVSSLSEQEFNALKEQVQQAAFAQLHHIDDLRDFYRDLFIKKGSGSLFFFDENSCATITLEEFRQAAQAFHVFPQDSCATNQLYPINLRSRYVH